MRQDKKLTIYMSLLFLVVFASFGFIIFKEKETVLFLPKIKEKLTAHLHSKYPKLKDKIKTDKIIHKNNKYILKITSKKNRNLYFNIIYENKNITDTYKKDFLEGKTLLDKIDKNLEKDISNRLNYKVKVKSSNTLNNYSKKVQKEILKENNLLNLSVYNIEKDIEVNKIDNSNLYKEITKLDTDCYKNKINPKYYNITITNKNNITESIRINNLSRTLIKKSDLKLVINDIINNKKSNILDKYNITYKYLN